MAFRLEAEQFSCRTLSCARTITSDEVFSEVMRMPTRSLTKFAFGTWREPQTKSRRSSISLTGAEPGLLGYWRMDESTGATLTDASGHGQTGALFGGTTWTNSTAPIVAGAGSALNFNAALGQAVTIPNFAINPNPHPLTIMCWFKSPTTNLNGALVNKYVSSSYNGFQLFMVGGHLKGWYFRDAANNVYNGGPMDAGPVNDGLWHHAAMVIDYTQGRLYLDGVLKSSLPWTGTAGPASTTQPISLGVYPGDSFWSGQLEDVSIWNASLSLYEIQFYMNRPPVGIEGSLSGYWSLDEGPGTTAFDSSGYGVNGTISGNPF